MNRAQRRAAAKNAGPRIPRPSTVEDFSAEETAEAFDELERKGLIVQSRNGSHLRPTPELMAMIEAGDERLPS